MATKKTIQLEVDTNSQDAQKQFDNLRKSIADTTQQLEKFTGTEKENSKEADNLRRQLADLDVEYGKLSQSNTDLGATFEDVFGEVKPLTAQMGEMEDRLYQMALAGDTASKEYKELLTEVGKYKRIQQDTDMIVDGAATTMSQKLGGAIQGVAGGFAVAQGAMALMGTESEKFEETMIKLNAAMAISQGIAGLGESKKAFKAMGLSAKTALKGIKTGVAATGIGVFLVAIGAIVAYWDEIKSFVDGTTEGQREQIELLGEGDEILKSQRTTMQQEVQLLNAQGATEGEIHKVKLKQLDAEVAQAKLRVKVSEEQKASQVAAAKRNVKILQGIIEFLVKPIDLLIFGYNKIATALKMDTIGYVSKKVASSVSQYFIDVNEISKEAQVSVDAAKDALDKVETDRKILEANFKKTRAQGYKDAAASEKEAADALLAIQRETKDKELALLEESRKKEEKLRDEQNKRESEDLQKRWRTEELTWEQFEKLNGLRLEQWEKDKAEIRDKYDAIEIAKKKAHEDKLKEIKNAFLNEMEAETTEFNKNKFYTEEEWELQSVRDKYTRLLALAEKYGEDTSVLVTNQEEAEKIIKDKYREQEEATEKEAQKKKFEMASSALSAIGDLATAFAGESEAQQKRAFEINKAVSLTQAIMSTAQGIMVELSHPAKSLTFTNYASAAIVAATGAAQIATIAKTKFKGAASGSSPDAPSGEPSASAQPSFNVVGDSGMNQLAQLQMQPTQAFVVSGDITTAQSLDRNKIQNATI